MRETLRSGPAGALVALALLLGLVAGACGDDDKGDDGGGTAAGSSTSTTSTTEAGAGGSTTTTGGQPAATTTTTTTKAATPTPTEPPTTLADSDKTGKSELPDGRHFGYWKTFEIGDTIAYGEFDLAYFLSGKEAEQAAKEHGEESPPPNDYFIVNDNPKLRTLIASGKTKVTVLAGNGGGPETTSSNVADFAVDRHEDHGFWVTIANGIVTVIEEQYQP